MIDGMRVPIVTLAAVVALAAAACGDVALTRHGSAALAAAAPGPMASATPAVPDRRVGALFLGAGPMHTCTGAVLDSASGDLILTAAHCLTDDADATFVPGFQDDATADQTWRVDAVYLDPRWIANQDPAADFAIARVSRDGGGTPEAQAGTGFQLASAPRPGTVVTVVGYGSGVGGGPISCHAAVADDENGFPSLPCAGLVAGVSGAPWTTGSAITGLVGGLDGGGCNENLSYSPPFDDAITRLLARAEAGGPGDTTPASFSDGC